MTKGERKLRHILESLRLPFHSQDQGDFTVYEFVLECDGPHHEKATQVRHDAWKERELRKLGFFPIRFKEDWILQYPDMVAMIIQSYVTMAQETAKR